MLLDYCTTSDNEITNLRQVAQLPTPQSGAPASGTKGKDAEDMGKFFISELTDEMQGAAAL